MISAIKRIDLVYTQNPILLVSFHDLWSIQCLVPKCLAPWYPVPLLRLKRFPLSYLTKISMRGYLYSAHMQDWLQPDFRWCKNDNDISFLRIPSKIYYNNRYILQLYYNTSPCLSSHIRSCGKHVTIRWAGMLSIRVGGGWRWSTRRYNRYQGNIESMESSGSFSKVSRLPYSNHAYLKEIWYINTT